MTENKHLVLAVTGASGAYAAEQLIAASPWPVALVVSRWGKTVFAEERGDLERLFSGADSIHDNDDLRSPLASGSVATRGMVVLPCSTHTLGSIAAGLGNTLIPRAAHCHLKERRTLVLCLRESPLTLIDLDNANKVATAGGIIMPLSPPFFMFSGRLPEEISLTDIMDSFVDRVLSVFGHEPGRNWEDVR
ncbi:MAG: UbiX family flavin prenyltransferase [bacterium]|nr:UbiX family flavin prenyltransferase [bacterium]MDT8396272.1 UbiX family flavin prenyltransferase [bacterium]